VLLLLALQLLLLLLPLLREAPTSLVHWYACLLSLPCFVDQQFCL
jgi:hypothetical protein